MTHLTLIINKREGGTFLDLVMVVSDISEQFLILNTSKEAKVMASLNEMLQKLNCKTTRTHSCVCTYIKWDLQHNRGVCITQQTHIETKPSLTAVWLQAKSSMLLWRRVSFKHFEK